MNEISEKIEMEIQKVQRKDEDEGDSSGFYSVGEQEIIVARKEGEDSHII